MALISDRQDRCVSGTYFCPFTANVFRSRFCFAETILKRCIISAGPSARMILIIGVVCFTGIASLTSAQTKIKCFQPANGIAKSGTLLLDCSNMIDKNIKQSNIEEWIKDYGDKGNIVYNRGVESIDLEHSNLSSIFVFPHMQSLKKLSFKNNNISAIESNAFVSLPALEELDLNYNSLHSKFNNN